MTRERLPLPEPAYVIGGKGFSGSDMHAYAEAENAALAEQVRVLREALQALRLAREQDKYRDWEKGVPEFKKAEALADTALEKTK